MHFHENFTRDVFWDKEVSITLWNSSGERRTPPMPNNTCQQLHIITTDHIFMKILPVVNLRKIVPIKILEVIRGAQACANWIFKKCCWFLMSEKDPLFEYQLIMVYLHLKMPFQSQRIFQMNFVIYENFTVFNFGGLVLMAGFSQKRLAERKITIVK